MVVSVLSTTSVMVVVQESPLLSVTRIEVQSSWSFAGEFGAPGPRVFRPAVSGGSGFRGSRSQGRGTGRPSRNANRRPCSTMSDPMTFRRTSMIMIDDLNQDNPHQIIQNPQSILSPNTKQPDLDSTASVGISRSICRVAAEALGVVAAEALGVVAAEALGVVAAEALDRVAPQPVRKQRGLTLQLGKLISRVAAKALGNTKPKIGELRITIWGSPTCSSRSWPARQPVHHQCPSSVETPNGAPRRKSVKDWCRTPSRSAGWCGSRESSTRG